MQLLIQFCSESSVSSAAQTNHLSRKAVTNFFDNCRGVWSDELTERPIAWVEPGIFEIDECVVRNVEVKEQIFANVWIAGVVERETGVFVCRRIANRTQQTLLPFVTGLVPRHSIICSDSLPSYSGLRELEYQHFSVNHSLHEYSRQEDLGDGDTIAVHCNTVEDLWS